MEMKVLYSSPIRARSISYYPCICAEWETDARNSSRRGIYLETLEFHKVGVDEALKTSTANKGKRGNSIDVYLVDRPIQGRNCSGRN